MKKTVGQPQKPNKVAIHIRVDRDTLDFLDLVAEKEKRTRGDTLDLIIAKLKNLI